MGRILLKVRKYASTYPFICKTLRGGFSLADLRTEPAASRWPWLFAHQSSSSVASRVDSIVKSDLLEQGNQARSLRDKALTVYAQPVALYSNVRRCIIFPIDTSN
jgi:hypothetical protein